MTEQEEQEFSSKLNKYVTLATAEAVEEHRLLGHSIAIWRDGKVVHLKPEEIIPLSQRQLDAKAT